MYRIEVIEFRKADQPGACIDIADFPTEDDMRTAAQHEADRTRRHPIKVLMYDIDFGRKYLGVIRGKEATA